MLSCNADHWIFVHSKKNMEVEYLRQKIIIWLWGTHESIKEGELNILNLILWGVYKDIFTDPVWIRMHFCRSEFWDTNLTWNTEAPQLTPCSSPWTLQLVLGFCECSLSLFTLHQRAKGLCSAISWRLYFCYFSGAANRSPIAIYGLLWFIFTHLQQLTIEVNIKCCCHQILYTCKNWALSSSLH